MSNMRRITKAEIIGGRRTTEMAYIASFAAEIEIRPLTSRQAAQIKAMKTRGIKVSLSGSPDELSALGNRDIVEVAQSDDRPEGMSVDIDLEAMTIAEYDANVQTVLWGLVLDERLSEADVHEFDPPKTVEEIAEAILKISNIDQEDMKRIAAFRG